MSQRFLIFYEKQNFNLLKSFLKESLLVVIIDDSFFQKIVMKKESEIYDLYILPTDISVNDLEYEEEIIDLNFQRNEILIFNQDDNPLYNYDLCSYFDDFSDDGFLNFPNVIDYFNNKKPKDLKEVYIINTVKNQDYEFPIVNIILTGSFSSGKTSFINTINKLLVDKYNEDSMWLPAFDYETTFGIYKIHYKENISKIIMTNEFGKEITYKDFPIGKNIKFLTNNETRLDIQKKYFQRNREINIEFPINKEYNSTIFKNIILIDTPGISSTNKTFEKIKPYLNSIDLKGYLFLFKTSYIDENFLEKSSNINKNFEEIINQILPDLNSNWVFDIFFNDDYLYKNLSGKAELYNFDNVMKYKDLIFNHSRLIPIFNYPLTMKFDESISNFFSESIILTNFLEKFYYKVLMVKELESLENKRINYIKNINKNLEPIIKFLEDINPTRFQSLDIKEFFIRLARIFFNNIREDYENKLLNKNLKKLDIKIILNQFHLFLDDIFNNRIKNNSSDFYNEGFNINAIDTILESLKIIKERFPDYYNNLKTSFIKNYKIIILIFLEKLQEQDYISYIEFNDLAEKFIKNKLEEKDEINLLIEEFNSIRKNKENEGVTLINIINKLSNTNKINKLYDLISKKEN